MDDDKIKDIARYQTLREDINSIVVDVRLMKEIMLEEQEQARKDRWVSYATTILYAFFAGIIITYIFTPF